MTIEEFAEKVARAQAQYPATAEKVLRKGARRMVDALKKNSPDSGREHKGKLNQSWRMKMDGELSSDLQANIYSNAPHFHLVDRGHIQKTPGGRVTGFVQGKHFLQATLDDEGEEIQEKMGQELLEKLGGDLR